MKRYCLLILIIFNSSFALASPECRARIQNASSDYLSNRFMNGSYMFVDAQGVIEKGAKGIHSVKSEKVLEADQQMPIASATKSMTAAAILKLQERGLLSVHDIVARHLDKQSGIWAEGKVPAWANEVTIHNMLTHRSGLPEYFMGAQLDVSLSHREINKQIANFAGDKELSFKPGEKHDYNNTNFVLLGLIIETVSGETAGKFFEKEFFTPLVMKDTKLLGLAETLQHQEDPESMNIPSRYFVTPTGAEPQFNIAKHPFLMTPFTDGGVASTTTDLIKWHQALHSGKVLSAKSYKQMTTGYYDVPGSLGTNSKIGYGLYISELENGDELFHHAGRALAIRSESGCVPKKDLCYAVISNVMNYIPKEMQGKVDMTKEINQLDIIHFTRHVLKSF
jgi:CubicO group peptidase (beta-lactamase class C family)